MSVAAARGKDDSDFTWTPLARDGRVESAQSGTGPIPGAGSHLERYPGLVPADFRFAVKVPRTRC